MFWSSFPYILYNLFFFITFQLMHFSKRKSLLYCVVSFFFQIRTFVVRGISNFWNHNQICFRLFRYVSKCFLHVFLLFELTFRMFIIFCLNRCSINRSHKNNSNVVIQSKCEHKSLIEPLRFFLSYTSNNDRQNHSNMVLLPCPKSIVAVFYYTFRIRWQRT